VLNGGLFTRDFLIEGICGTDAWTSLDDAAVALVRERLRALLSSFGKIKSPIEAETETELIWPTLEAIGWFDMSVQQNLSTKARDDVPDALLFADLAAKDKAKPLAAWQRFQHGACIVEAKRWNRALDRQEARRKEDGVPSTQMLRYLRRVDDVTNGGLRWGMLTNGRHWRLYFRGALSVAEDFLEVDLGRAFDLPGCEVDLLDRRPDRFDSDEAWRAHALKLFILLFGRTAFLPGHRGETFHQLALREGRQWEAQVARDLSDTVFGYVFPALAQALAGADGKPAALLDAAAIDEVRQGALVLLYRLLFVLYAEDRNLLPDESGPYADYSLTKLRNEVAEKKARGAAFSDFMKAYWSRLDGVFQAIAHGDDSLGIPPYNGGLFDPAAAPILARVQLSDAIVADIVFRLSHIDIGDGRPPRYINYRDLSVQQLGSVYERILEHGLKVEDGRVVGAESPAARKSSGSYYTPEELVALIIERAVGPFVEEQVKAFRAKAAALAGDSRTKEARLAELLPLDPATRLLDLKVCEPGHGFGPLPREPRRLAIRSGARRHGRSRRGSRLRAVCLAVGRPDRSHQGQDRRRGASPCLADRRVPARRPAHRAAHGPEARDLRGRQEPDGGGTGQGGALAAFLHRRRTIIVPRPPSALWRQHRRGMGKAHSRRPQGARRALQHRRCRKRRERRSRHGEH
jgi:hypothetical protein